MKSLFMIRHAKSSWGDLTLPDFERPLNDRGKHDAPMMAERMKASGKIPQALVSSTARRARKTAQAFADVFGIPDSRFILRDELYHASVDTLYREVSRIDDQFNSVALFSHNPGITQFVQDFGVARIDEMPTCGIMAITIPIKQWAEFREAKKAFWFFDYPKNAGIGS